MPNRLFVVVGVLVSFAAALFAGESAESQSFPSEAEIRKILVERIDVQRQGVGIVVGLVDPAGRKIIAHGSFDGDGRAVDGDTLFEIGSITKAFTALLLADAVVRGEASLDDPVAKLLPQNAKVPARNGRKITLLDLATHTSGLPRLPSNLLPADPANPYADYGEASLYEFLASHELARDVGATYEYSNLGAGLLGHALARRAGTSYAALVESRITGPLGMKSTVVSVGEPLRERLAPGHDPGRARVGNWDFDALAGAGAHRSTANDMLTFVAANIGLVDSPLAAAMRAMLKTRRPAASGLEIALGWHVFTGGGREIVWHNGGTGGYRSFIGFDPKRRAGVVVLTNMSTETGGDDIGRHLLDPSVPLAAPPKARKEVALDPKILDRYTGRYELAPGIVMTVTRRGRQLLAQITGQPAAEIVAESEKEFFYKIVNAQITFDAADEAPAKGLVLHQGGRNTAAKRIGDVEPQKVRPTITLDAAVLDRYVGRYQVAPTFVLEITREGAQLFAQGTGQPKFPLFAESETEFFFEVVDAQVTFVRDANGRATKLVLHQSGADVPATRIE
jgi:CubicO group peptidase (beta-lactamase class C family)